MGDELAAERAGAQGTLRGRDTTNAEPIRPPRPSNQQRLEACVQSMASRPDLPAFAHQVYEILGVVNDDDTTLRRLTGLLLKNYSLTTKILRTANSLYYNRAGRPILSVSHAIAYLGWNTIRDMAGGMLLFEHFQNGKRSPGLKELILCSLLTANHAREIAARVHYPRVEEAYLCGMFRNLGEILVAAYMPDAYAEVLKGISLHAWTVTHACLLVLGFGYEELGKAILRYWNLPEKVGVAMDVPEPGWEKVADETDLLRAITGFSHSLTGVVHRGDPARSPAWVTALLKRYGEGLSLNETAAGDILKAAVAETKATFDAAFIPIDHLRLGRQVEMAMQSIPEPIGAPAGEAPCAPVAEAGGPVSADLPEVILEGAVAKVRSVLTSGTDYDLNDILYMILEAVFRGGRFDRALIALITPDRASVEGRIGVGDGVDALLDLFRFPLSIRSGPIGPALIGRQDLFVDTSLDTRYENSSIQQVTASSYFGLLPLVVDRVVVGCIYFDRLSPGPAPGQSEKQLLLELRDSASKALAHKRST